jgi:predicted nucleotidyltransferase
VQHLSRIEARERAERAARLLSEHPNVRLVYLFGSAARSDPEGLVRDIDLAVLTQPALADQELLALRALLTRETGEALDVVSLNDAPIVLAREIADAGICLYAADPEFETEFVTRARARFWDFQPLREEQWRLIRERQEERLGPAS